MRPYVVRQGDYLERIAFTEGFDAVRVWNHPRNAALRELRPDPRQLCPGDVLCVPERADDEGHPLDLQADNAFGCRVPEVELSLRLATLRKGRPLRYVLHGAAERREGETDADGNLRAAVSMAVREVAIELPDLGVRLAVQVGALDPPDEPSGVAQRLGNLGLMPRDPAFEQDETARAASRASALATYQAGHGLPATGEIDEATLAKLREEHGC